MGSAVSDRLTRVATWQVAEQSGHAFGGDPGDPAGQGHFAAGKVQDDGPGSAGRQHLQLGAGQADTEDAAE